MAKKDNPNLIFRREWWDNLRHKSPELFKETLSILFSTFFDGKDFNPYSFDEQGTNPSPAEDLAIPMLKSALADRETYRNKCDRLSANARKQNQLNTIANNCTQLNSIANNCEQLQGNIIEGNVKEGNVKEVIFFSACEETSPEKEKKQLLFLSSLYYLSQGHTKPMAEAISAYDYNETENWTEHKKNGRDVDHSANKLKWMQGWKCSKGPAISPEQGKTFADIMASVSWDDQTILDHFIGIRHSADSVTILFDNKNSTKLFLSRFGQDAGWMQRLYEVFRQHGTDPTGKNFYATCEK